MNGFTSSFDSLSEYSDRQTTTILDIKTGDVNGDGTPDTVYLTGEEKGNPFYENIKVIIQDARTMQRYVISLYPNYSMAYTPWLFLGNFTGLNADEIMVNLPVAGSGALTYYYIISFMNNNAAFILGPEQFIPLTAKLEFEVVYMDNYKVSVKSKKLNQSYVLDVSDRKEAYEGTVYEKDGRLINPRKGFVIDLPHLYPVRLDGSEPYRLESLQDIAGTSHADRLGYAVTYWKSAGYGSSWVVDLSTFLLCLVKTLSAKCIAPPLTSTLPMRYLPIRMVLMGKSAGYGLIVFFEYPRYPDHSIDY